MTGGAGYVGSHLVAKLLEDDNEVVVLDDLSTGHQQAVLPDARLIYANLSDHYMVDKIVSEGPWDAVFHFAALSLVGESVKKPYYYIQTNLMNGINLIQACAKHDVKKFILSSTAAIFGTPLRQPINDFSRIVPASPYGESKYFLERILLWADKLHGLKSACLRYFNAAGCDEKGRLGEDHRPETHLIPLVIDAALGRRESVSIFGTDYPTKDGTCIRDYIHVSDLADAHIRMLPLLNEQSQVFNLGLGKEYTVKDVIESVKRISGRQFQVDLLGRRPGDPTRLVADSERLKKTTGWNPKYTDLDDIIRTAYVWREAHPRGYSS